MPPIAATTTTVPSIPETRRRIAAEIIRDAVRRYRDAVARQAETMARSDDDPDLNKFVDLSCAVTDEIGDQLVRSILALGARGDLNLRPYPERTRWPNRGVIFEGTLYLAAADLDCGLEEGESSDRQIMRLLTIDMANVVGVDDPPPAPPAATPAPTPDPMVLTIDERIEASEALIERHHETVARRGVPLDVVEQEYPLYSYPRRDTPLAEVVAEEAEDFDPAHDMDRGIWEDGRLLALIRRTADGRAMIVRFEADDSIEAETRGGDVPE